MREKWLKFGVVDGGLLGFTDSLVLQMHYGLLQLDPNKFYGCVCIFHNEYSRVYLDLLHRDHLRLCDCCDYHAASRTSTTTCRTCDIALLLLTSANRYGVHFLMTTFLRLSSP